MAKIEYTFSADGDVCYGTFSDGKSFCFDSKYFSVVSRYNWRLSSSYRKKYIVYVVTGQGTKLHNILLPSVPKGMEVDHINMDPMDNRLCNLRICTHQQNQINQGLQKNNTSGVVGVSFYKPRGKYRARIKIGNHDIHLGYYETFEQAVQARNVGMECMFGEYGRYNRVEETPRWIKEKVINICRRFAELSICKAFFISLKNGDCTLQ